MSEQLFPFAETVPYWQTSRSTPDTWLDRAEKEIVKRGGRVNLRALTSGAALGLEAFHFVFDLDGDQYRLTWPVLPTKNGDKQAAARRQAATLLYHDVKAKCVSATVLGTRRAFHSYLYLPGAGKTVSELSDPDFIAALPKLLAGGD